MELHNTDGPVAWFWRSVPKWSTEPGTAGIELCEADAKDAAERAMSSPRVISAIVVPLGMSLGKWEPLGGPSIALPTYSGGVRWHDDVHGIGVAHLAQRHA
jgi:hypothetical protein